MIVNIGSEFFSIPLRFLDWLRRQVRLVRVGAKKGNPLYVGIGSTNLFLTLICVLALLPQRVSGEWSWRLWSFILSPSNEIGDTLAGIAGALAFLWIIVTVMLQGKELASQREELKLTRKVMEEQRQAAQDMADAMAAQSKIFEGEQKEREEQAFDREIEALIKEFLSIALRKISDNSEWWISKPADPFSGTSDIRSISIYLKEEFEFETRVIETAKQLRKGIWAILEDDYAQKAAGKPNSWKIFDRLAQVLDRISLLKEECSPTMKAFLRSVEILYVSEPLLVLLNEPLAWTETK